MSAILGAGTRHAQFVLIVQCLLIAGCIFNKDRETPTEPSRVSNGPVLSTTYSHRSATLNMTIDIGVWMHRGQQLERATIAKWLDVPYEQKELFEPINVLWVDPTASSEVAARDNVVAFLNQCDFRREGDQFFSLIPKHSGGYSAWGNGRWREQYDRDDAWVQMGVFELSNNHGRIFPAFQATSPTGSVYVTSGAFSRETGYGIAGVDCAAAPARCHAFVSFNIARDRLNCSARGWTTSGPIDFRNTYPLSMGLSFSTADHTGALVFERSR